MNYHDIEDLAAVKLWLVKVYGLAPRECYVIASHVTEAYQQARGFILNGGEYENYTIEIVVKRKK